MAIKHYVRPAGSGWDVVVAGHRRGVAHEQTKKAAIAHARRLVRSAGGGEIRVLNAHGKVTGEATVGVRRSPTGRAARRASATAEKP